MGTQEFSTENSQSTAESESLGDRDGGRTHWQFAGDARVGDENLPATRRERGELSGG